VAAERRREEDETVPLISMPPLFTHSTVDDRTRYLERSVDMTVHEREYIDTMERNVHKVPGLPASRADLQSPPRRSPASTPGVRCGLFSRPAIKPGDGTGRWGGVKTFRVHTLDRKFCHDSTPLSSLLRSLREASNPTSPHTPILHPP
jgi:hypothetical protein